MKILLSKNSLHSLGWAVKLFSAGFFIVHYGLFMLMHFVFIIAISANGLKEGVLGTPKIMAVLVAVAPVIALGLVSSFVSYAVSFRENYLKNGEDRFFGFFSFLGAYSRVIPMHLTIIIGASFGAPALVLVLIKTVADLFSHLLERRNVLADY